MNASDEQKKDNKANKQLRIALDAKFWLVALCLITIAAVNNHLIRRVGDEVLIIQKKQDRDEKLMTDAIYQAVQRWNDLAEQNPNLKVPAVPPATPTPPPQP